MKCQDIQLELSLYFDDVLSADEANAVNRHLAICPLCRQKLSETHEIRTGLRSLDRPEIPVGRLIAIREAVSARLGQGTSSPAFHLIEAKERWRDVWLMPYAVGTSFSVIFGFTLLWLVFLPLNRTLDAASSGSGRNSDASILLASSEQASAELSPIQYANSRHMISGVSPSINPKGALVALTSSLIRGKMKDEEVVVVADVFGNGLARIAEVVEPSHDQEAIRELRKALQTDPEYAPFVPADMDNRSDSVRVILKLQTVDVSVPPNDQNLH